MRRPVANPPNPFLSAQREYLEEPPPVELEVYEETSRSILSENDSPDISFRWSVNPYRGCQHACAYCYARPTHEYLGLGAGTDFDSKITAKVNAPELLVAALKRKGWQGETIVFSGVTDCYQPLEAVYQLTRRCLEVCRDFSNPVGIVTKSFLVVRDAELIAEIARRASARVFVSIPFADEVAARAIESGAPTPARRFEALARLRDAGVPTGLMLAPIIPGLNDRDIPEILERAAQAGATSAAYTALRLPGNVSEVFLSRVRAARPDQAGRVEALVRQLRDGRLNDPRFGHRMHGHGVHWDGIRRLFEVAARRVGLHLHSRSTPQQRSGTGVSDEEQRPDLLVAPKKTTEMPTKTPRNSCQLPLFGQ